VQSILAHDQRCCGIGVSQIDGLIRSFTVSFASRHRPPRRRQRCDRRPGAPPGRSP